jgi:hypothetical protein
MSAAGVSLAAGSSSPSALRQVELWEGRERVSLFKPGNVSSHDHSMNWCFMHQLRSSNKFVKRMTCSWTWSLQTQSNGILKAAVKAELTAAVTKICLGVSQLQENPFMLLCYACNPLVQKENRLENVLLPSINHTCPASNCRQESCNDHNESLQCYNSVIFAEFSACLHGSDAISCLVAWKKGLQSPHHPLSLRDSYYMSLHVLL